MAPATRKRIKKEDGNKQQTEEEELEKEITTLSSQIEEKTKTLNEKKRHLLLSECGIIVDRFRIINCESNTRRFYIQFRYKGDDFSFENQYGVVEFPRFSYNWMYIPLHVLPAELKLLWDKIRFKRGDCLVTN